MRALSLIGLVIVVLIVGVLAKKQMAAVRAPAVVPETGIRVPAPSPTANARDQSQQIQQQYQQALDAALQQTRRTADDAE